MENIEKIKGKCDCNCGCHEKINELVIRINLISKLMKKLGLVMIDKKIKN